MNSLHGNSERIGDFLQSLTAFIPFSDEIVTPRFAYMLVGDRLTRQSNAYIKTLDYRLNYSNAAGLMLLRLMSDRMNILKYPNLNSC